MKRCLISTAALLLAGGGAAHAQSSVQVYGLVDTAVERLTNVNTAPAGAAPRGGSLVRMPDLAGGLFPSRIGFRGTEDLGNGLQAIFTLENGFASDTGALNFGGRLWGRQAFVGLSSGWGAVAIGRQYTMLTSSWANIDIIGPTQWGLSALDPYIPNARSDNSIGYKGTFDGVTVGATYSLGRDAVATGGPGATGCFGESATDKRACRQWSALLRYDAANFGVAVAYDRYNGGNIAPQPGLVPGIGGAFGPATSSLSDSRLNLGAYGKLGPMTVGGGLLRRTNEGNVVNPRTNLYYIGASYSLTPAFIIDGQIARMDATSSPLAANDSNDTNMAILRGTYNLSKRTAVYGVIGRVNNKGAAARSLSAGASVVPGGSQNGIMIGIKHSF